MPIIIIGLGEALEAFDSRLGKKLETIMSAISNFVAAVTPALALVSTKLDNITVDIAGLKTKIAELIENGSLNEEDMAALTAIQASVENLGAKATEVADIVPDVPAPPAV